MLVHLNTKLAAESNLKIITKTVYHHSRSMHHRAHQINITQIALIEFVQLKQMLLKINN